LKIEKKVVEQFKAGNEMAFELIFHRSKGKLKGFLKKVLPRGEDEESLMQEVYVSLWMNRRSIETDRNLETYLFSIARNRVIDVMRKRFHQQQYLENLYKQLNDEPDNSLDTLAIVEYAELEKQIFSLIEALPEKRKLIFKLNKLEGLSYKEIAQRLNISENTVDTQIRSALSFLRQRTTHLTP
jgi:RNA polymerase sigma-70 factor (ECF subfamily)